MIAAGIRAGTTASVVSCDNEVLVPEKVTPMLHVPDVKATADWYASIGFNIVRLAQEDGDGGETTWALLRLGESEVMLNCGGKVSDAWRREVDLYVHCDDVNAMRSRIAGKGSLVEDVHDTFYGMREFILRDCNGFWITFGQPSVPS
jgi:uncharacterized glyoxalase superfamily protein PhnB